MLQRLTFNGRFRVVAELINCSISWLNGTLIKSNSSELTWNE